MLFFIYRCTCIHVVRVFSRGKEQLRINTVRRMRCPTAVCWCCSFVLFDLTHPTSDRIFTLELHVRTWYRTAAAVLLLLLRSKRNQCPAYSWYSTSTNVNIFLMYTCRAFMMSTVGLFRHPLQGGGCCGGDLSTIRTKSSALYS